jgi:dimethylhistidine N-methyltransferase
MMPSATVPEQRERRSDTLTEVLAGLRLSPKSIAPKWFYDAHGSWLFQQIVLQPEYYLPRVEAELLQQHRTDILAALGPDVLLLEPGAGDLHKAQGLLGPDSPVRAYVPLEISVSFLAQHVAHLQAEHPEVAVLPVGGDYLNLTTLPLPTEWGAWQPVVFFPGSSIGNYNPTEAAHVLARFRNLTATLGREAALLVGIDLEKDEATLNAAYNDAAGFTARFNLNALAHLRQAVGLPLHENDFAHRAFYHAPQHRVEMHLVAQRTLDFTLGGEAFHLDAGEYLHTENSYKYTLPRFNEVLQQAGYRFQQAWIDNRQWFSLVLALPQ